MSNTHPQETFVIYKQLLILILNVIFFALKLLYAHK